VDQAAKRYQRNGKPIHEAAILDYSEAQIIDLYQQRFRGLAEYYKYATDRDQFGKLKHIMEEALTKTLADKFRTSVVKTYRRYKGTRTVDGCTYKTLQVEVPTNKGSRCIYWGAVPLKTAVTPWDWTLLEPFLVNTERLLTPTSFQSQVLLQCGNGAPFDGVTDLVGEKRRAGPETQSRMTQGGVGYGMAQSSSIYISRASPLIIWLWMP